jgi:LPXTG-motif cell wall-anchored protein
MSSGRTRTLAALGATALALAYPVAALAQSAGDEQYADPFGKLDKEKKQQQQQRQQHQQRQSSNRVSSGTQGQPVQSAQALPQATETQTTTSSELPRTGAPAGLLAASGAALLGSGALLRRRVA